MADRTPRRAVLMSIHPRYAEALLDGTKTVELRKNRIAEDTSHIVIYATAPVGRVVGWVRPVRVEADSPSAIWEKHQPRLGIRRAAYRRYFKGHRRAVAIHVDAPCRLEAPLELSAVEAGLTPPQCWRYLSPAAAATVGINP